MGKRRSSLMSFSFGSFEGVNDLPPDVIMLFQGMQATPEKNLECSLDIIRGGLKGTINTNRPFNMRGWEYTYLKNERLGTFKKQAKQKYIAHGVGGNSDEFNQAMRSGGITEDQLAISAIEELTDAFEELIDNEELNYAISTIKSLNEDFILDYDVDLVSLIKKAVGGYHSSIEKLKEVCEEFTLVADYVKVILESGATIESCFG